MLLLVLVSSIALAKEKNSSRIYSKSLSSIVEPASETFDGNTQIDVYCNNSDLATGGGFKVDSTAPKAQRQNLVVTESYPILNDTNKPIGWTINVKNLDGGPENYLATVLCQKESK